MGEKRVWALEDCRHVSSRLEAFVVASGERVIGVPPKLMGVSCRAERTSGKSDVIHVRAIAKARVRGAPDELRRVRELTRTADDRVPQIKTLIVALRPELLELKGCGTSSAATLIGRAGAQRFNIDRHFARQAGAAPIPASSGRTDRRRSNRGGDRQLKAALHRIAVTQGQHPPPAKACLAREQAEGKSRIEALRCLKRHLARTVWQLLRVRRDRPMSPSLNIAKNNDNAPAIAFALT